MYDQYFTGFLHRVEDRLFIQWYQGTKIDNLQFPAFFFVKKLGYVEAKMGRIAISDDCQIFSRTAYAGFPKWNLEILGDKGGGFYCVVERFRFQIERKAFRTHTRPQQSGGIICERGINNPGTG